MLGKAPGNKQKYTFRRVGANVAGWAQPVYCYLLKKTTILAGWAHRPDGLISKPDGLKFSRTGSIEKAGRAQSQPDGLIPPAGQAHLLAGWAQLA